MVKTKHKPRMYHLPRTDAVLGLYIVLWIAKIIRAEETINHNLQLQKYFTFDCAACFFLNESHHQVPVTV